MGLRIPDQISIVGYDDNIYAEFVRPRLTTVHQDIHQKGVICPAVVCTGMIDGRNFKRNEYQEPGAADKKRVCEGIAGSLLQFTELIWLVLHKV